MRLILTLLSLVLMGCSTTPKINNADVRNLISENTDVIVGSADSIDEIVKGSDYATPVKIETDNIRSSVLKITFDKIDALYSEIFAAEIKKNAGLQKQIVQLTNENEELKSAEKRKQLSLLRYCSIFFTIITVPLLYFKQRELAGLSALLGLFLFGIGQIISSPFFVWLIACVIIISIAVLCFALYKNNVKEDTSLLVYKTLEDVYNKSNVNEKKWMDDNIFNKLSSRMDKVNKAVIDKSF